MARGGQQATNKPGPQFFRKGRWNRTSGTYTQQFERALGADHRSQILRRHRERNVGAHCRAECSCIGPGDEVIVPPYTFNATINAVLMQHALPVFVDSDPETFQIDANKIEAAITKRTALILPYISAAVQRIWTPSSPRRRSTTSRSSKDACQAHLSGMEGKKGQQPWRYRRLQFPASKNLNSGEGGAVLTSNESLSHRARGFHNNGNPYGSPFNYTGRRLQSAHDEFQGALLLEQLTRWKRNLRSAPAMRNTSPASFRKSKASAPRASTKAALATPITVHVPLQPRALPQRQPKEAFLKAFAAEGIRATAATLR